MKIRYQSISMPIDRPSPGTIADLFDVDASTLIFSFAGSAKLTGSRSCVDGTYSASFFAASSFFAVRALRFFSFPIAILKEMKNKRCEYCREKRRRSLDKMRTCSCRIGLPASP